MKRFAAALGLAVFLAAASAYADGLIVIPRHPPGFIPPRHAPYIFAPLEIKYHHVTVKIAGQVAVTEVDQSFFNPNSQRLEGDYIFPIPKGAQIDKFSMDINGTSAHAELLDAEKARSIYEDIVRRMKDPALLEYAGQGLFRVRIFPIEPHSEKHVRLKYVELLRSDSGLVGYTYPLNTEKFSAQPIQSVSVKVELESKQALKTVYSPSHPVEVRRNGNYNATVGFETSGTRPDTDFQLFYSVEQKDIGISVLTFNDGSDPAGGTFALLASPSAEIAKEKIARKDIVFVLDTSGSMAQNNKLEQAKKALFFCLKNLNRDDRFELVRFSTEAEPLFGRLMDADEANRRKAEDFIRELRPIGGTAIEDALYGALKPASTQSSRSRPYVIVFLTDGKPTIGTTDEKDLLAGIVRTIGDRTIRIFCFGIGADVNTHLLDGIAEKTRAASQYVLPDEDLEVKVSNFYTKINDPVLSDLKLSFSGGVRVSKMHPSALPDLFKGDQLVVFGRYGGSGDAAIRLEGTVNGEHRVFTSEAAFPAHATEHTFLPKIWATRRVGFLLDQIRLHGEEKELKDEIVDLARKHGIVTPYTAYLIVEDETSRNIVTERRTLQSFEQDRRARVESSRMYKEANVMKSGSAAVGGAQAIDALNRADNMAALATANDKAFRGQTGASKAGAENIQKAIRNQETRTVNGRTFYQNGSLWVDALAQTKQSAPRRQVQFNSAEYFALMRRHKDAAQWFSVGRNVQVLIGDTVYEIVD